MTRSSWHLHLHSKPIRGGYFVSVGVLQLLSGRIFYFAHDYPPGYFRDATVHPPDTFFFGGGVPYSATAAFRKQLEPCCIFSVIPQVRVPAELRCGALRGVTETLRDDGWRPCGTRNHDTNDGAVCLSWCNFIARQYTDAYWYSKSVRLSVSPLRSRIRWKRLNISSQFFHHTVAQSF